MKSFKISFLKANTIDLQEIQNEFHQNGKNLDTFDVLNENSYKSEYEQSNKRNKLRETRKGTKVQNTNLKFLLQNIYKKYIFNAK